MSTHKYLHLKNVNPVPRKYVGRVITRSPPAGNPWLTCDAERQQFYTNDDKQALKFHLVAHVAVCLGRQHRGSVALLANARL